MKKNGQPDAEKAMRKQRDGNAKDIAQRSAQSKAWLIFSELGFEILSLVKDYEGQSGLTSKNN